MRTEPAALRAAIVKRIEESGDGVPALDVVNYVVAELSASDRDVIREIRRMLEAGDLAVGEGLKLFIQDHPLVAVG